MIKKNNLYVVKIIKGKDSLGQPIKEDYKAFANWKTAKAVVSAIHSLTGIDTEIEKVVRKEYEARRKIEKQNQ